MTRLVEFYWCHLIKLCAVTELLLICIVYLSLFVSFYRLMASLRTFCITVICAALLFSACTTSTPETQPKNLDEAITYFEKHWNIVEKTKFKIHPEQNAVSELHLTTGMWIRNTWIHANRDTNLTNYFHRLGIFHPDDISSIILTSLHRKLNNQEVDLPGQVKVYLEYWTSMNECKNRQRKQAIANFHQHNVGDLITISMAVDTSDGERNAVIYACPQNDWTFNPKVDLMIVGIITKKYFINDSSNVFFTVKIKKLNNPNTTIGMENAMVGDFVDFQLRGLTIN